MARHTNDRTKDLIDEAKNLKSDTLIKESNLLSTVNDIARRIVAIEDAVFHSKWYERRQQNGPSLQIIGSSGSD